MIENTRINFNIPPVHDNPFACDSLSSSVYSNPFICGFNFGGDVASIGLYSGMNLGLPYYSCAGAMPLQFPYSSNWGGVGLPICPSISDAYNGFVGGGMYSMPFLMQTAVPKFQFSTAPASNYSMTSVWNNSPYSYNFNSTSRTTTTDNNNRTQSVPPAAAKNAATRKMGKDLSPAFVEKVKQVAQRLNCNYEDLIAIMNSESGLNPQAQNRGSGAVGLIQFMGVAIQQLNKTYGLNLTAAKIKNMSAIEQMDLVEKYLLMCKKMAFPSNAKLSGADLYSLIFLPGRASRETLTSRGEGYYNANRGLDKNGDGKITKGDLAQHINSKRVRLVA